jgi:hypothetical protein
MSGTLEATADVRTVSTPLDCDQSEEAMIKINRRSSFLRPLLVTALPLVLLEASTMTAYSTCVSVTGTNGGPRANGGAATAAATTDPSSCAATTGGNGGSGVLINGNPTSGGNGGAATSTATTSINSGDASAEATSVGGHGGAGAANLIKTGLHFSGKGGAGGTASSSANASSGTASATATASSTGGLGSESGAGRLGPAGAGGTASSSAAASSTTGSVSATASSAGGVGAYPSQPFGGSATVSATTRNSAGAALTTSASALEGSALTNATVGSGSESLVAIAAGQAVSNAILIPKGPNIGIGAMSAAYGGVPGGNPALEYAATAVFSFSPSADEALDLNLLSYDVSGIGFNSLELQVTLPDGTNQTYTFSSPTGSDGAEAFFAEHALPLGTISAGVQSSVSLSYDLSFSAFTVANGGNGFGFTYDIADPPLAGSAPEPSTWEMMLVGFAGLVFAGYRRSQRGAAFAA